jgi:uncharacterized protein
MINRHCPQNCFVLLVSALVAASVPGPLGFALGQEPGRDTSAVSAPGDTPLHRAAREGDLVLLRSLLGRGADANVRDAAGQSPLLEAVAAGRLAAVRLLLGSGANVNAVSSAGRTPLIEAAERGHLDTARLLIAAGADLNLSQRGSGTALETAERAGHTDLAAMLRQAGARSSGKSVGDKVCVRPWKGDGYCGTVEAVDRTNYRIRLTEVVGCENGCPAKAECSAGRPVGGAGGLHAGDAITTVSWCLTHTGVAR